MIQTEPAFKICDKGIYKKVKEKQILTDFSVFFIFISRIVKHLN